MLVRYLSGPLKEASLSTLVSSSFVGLFFFDARFRPVPLAQTFVGVYETKPMQQKVQMDEIAYEKVQLFFLLRVVIIRFVSFNHSFFCRLLVF